MSTSIVYNKNYKEDIYNYPDIYFDLALCDVPYGINVGRMAYLKEKKTTVLQKNKKRLNPNRNKKLYSYKDWDNKVPEQDYFDELKRISKHQIIFGAFQANWDGLGKGKIIWDKLVADGVSFKRYEYAYCSFINHEYTIKLLWAGMMQAKSIYEPTVQQGNKKLNEKRIHPCHKPVMLYDLILLKFGYPNMKIIDTHLGSGSSRISADKFGYDFVGYEIDEEYFNDEELRWKNHKKQLKLF